MAYDMMVYFRSCLTGIRYLRRLIVPLAAGAAVTIAVSWACAAWSPVRKVVDPFRDPSSLANVIAETVNPDGVKGLHYREAGLGWAYMWQSGWRSRDKDGHPIIFRTQPYGGVYHQTAGWPVSALRSRVEVLDSQAASRRDEGEPEVIPIPQRRRWQLPAREIIYRGLAAKDLPDWLRAQPSRRLPLVPLVGGFVLDTMIFAAAYALLALVIRTAWRRWRPMPRGFSIVKRDRKVTRT